MNKEPYRTDQAALNQIVRVTRSLLAFGSSGVESISGGPPIDRQQLTKALEEHIQSQPTIPTTPTPDVTAKLAAAEALSKADAALARTANGEPVSNLTDLEIASLEAIIEVTGRPALRYSNGIVQTPSSLLGENEHWNVLILTSRNKINRASASVGQIALINNMGYAQPIGTGWRTGADMIATNRHVVELFVSNFAQPRSSWKLDSVKKPFVDFAVTDNAATAQRFDIAEIFYVAKEDEIDLAFLKLRPISSPLPAALVADWNIDSPGRFISDEHGTVNRFEGREIYVVGHPYRKMRSELVTTVFGVADGTKRWSPGLVKAIDDRTYVLEHDCSTLGGNSGSCVFTADENRVIGIHVGGLDVNRSGKGSANQALAFSRMDKHPAAEIIRNGKLKE
jgi:hypothetical protein